MKPVTWLFRTILCAAFTLVNIYQHRRRLPKVNLQMIPQGA